MNTRAGDDGEHILDTVTCKSAILTLLSYDFSIVIRLLKITWNRRFKENKLGGKEGKRLKNKSWRRKVLTEPLGMFSLSFKSTGLEMLMFTPFRSRKKPFTDVICNTPGKDLWLAVIAHQV